MPDSISDAVLAHIDGIASRLAELLPWVKHLNTAEQAELLADLTQAWVQVRQTGQTQALTEVLEDWEATAEALQDSQFMHTWQQPHRPDDYVPWEQVRGELDLSRDPEAGRP